MATLVFMLPKTEPSHTYYASAHLLSAEFEEPLQERIAPRAHVKLPKDGRPEFNRLIPSDWTD